MDLHPDGAPKKPKMRTHKDASKVAHPGKVKESKWRNIEKPYTQYPHHSKNMHASVEGAYLHTRPETLGDGNYANLGVFRGYSTFAFACGLDKIKGKGKVYAVDLYQYIEPEEMLRIFKEMKKDQYLEICKGFTHEWPEKLDVKFKFIFIDADHHYETCKQDFELWSPLLEDGGQIAFHDVDMITINKVIEELGSDWKLVDHVYRIKSFKRK